VIFSGLQLLRKVDLTSETAERDDGKSDEGGKVDRERELSGQQTEMGQARGREKQMDAKGRR